MKAELWHHRTSASKVDAEQFHFVYILERCQIRMEEAMWCLGLVLVLRVIHVLVSRVSVLVLVLRPGVLLTLMTPY